MCSFVRLRVIATAQPLSSHNFSQTCEGFFLISLCNSWPRRLSLNKVSFSLPPPPSSSEAAHASDGLFVTVTASKTQIGPWNKPISDIQYDALHHMCFILCFMHVFKDTCLYFKEKAKYFKQGPQTTITTVTYKQHRASVWSIFCFIIVQFSHLLLHKTWVSLSRVLKYQTIKRLKHRNC